jgi:glycine C-acetyltransferase/8-amino-7-oxononanoate synthase
VAEAGLGDEVDLVVGTLGTALGSYGGFVACDHEMAQHLASTARPLLHSTAAPPATVAAAMAALELLVEQPRRVEKLHDNAGVLREALSRESFDVSGSSTQVVPIVVGDAVTALRICEAALSQGVFVDAVRPPVVPDGTARLRLTAMASHTRTELREAAQVLARAALQCGFSPSAAPPIAASRVAVAPLRALPRAA